MKKILLGIMLVMLVTLTSCLSGLIPDPDTIEKEPDVVQIENDIMAVYEKISYGCVGVYATGNSGASLGSGVIYKENNGTYYVVTNNHVIDKMTEYKIYRGGSKYYRATLVGTDAHNDIAVLTFSLDLFGGDEVYIHDIFNYETESVKAGQTVLAIGCPLGLENYNYLSTGVVSKVTKNQIMTNAEINPGNSGGGLFNMSGRLIGINTEKKTYTNATNTDGSTAQVPVEGIAYAISLSIVKQSIKDIEAAGGDISRPKLGITVTAINRYISESNYVKHLPNSNDAGILVVDAGNGTAFEAGVRTYDIILSMNGANVFDLDDLSFIMSTVKVGDTVILKIYRSTTGQTTDISVTLK